MDEERASGVGLRWAIAGIAALLGAAGIAWLIASIVPRIADEAVGGRAEAEQLATACKFAGPIDGELCQRSARVTAALDEGRCEAARQLAVPILAVDGQASPLAQKLREVTELRLAERCGEQPSQPRSE